MAGNSWVAQGPEGGFEVYYNGERVPRNFATQDEAERFYNSLAGGANAYVTGDPFNSASPPAGSPQGVIPATVPPEIQLTIEQGRLAMQQKQLEYQYARMNLIEARAAGTAEAQQRAQEKYQNALIELQTEQQKQKTLQDQVSTQMDIWKTQAELASPNRTPGARYHTPAPNPTLPANYYTQNGGLQTGGQPPLAGGSMTPPGTPVSPTPTQAAPPKLNLSILDSLDRYNGSLTPDQQTQWEKQAAMIIRYKQAHPEEDPQWAAFAKEHPDMTGGATGEWTGPGAASSAGRSLNYYGGQWDTARGRVPGGPDAGSVQELNRNILQKIKEQAQAGQGEDIWKKYLSTGQGE